MIAQKTVHGQQCAALQSLCLPVKQPSDHEMSRDETRAFVVCVDFLESTSTTVGDHMHCIDIDDNYLSLMKLVAYEKMMLDTPRARKAERLHIEYKQLNLLARKERGTVVARRPAYSGRGLFTTGTSCLYLSISNFRRRSSGQDTLTRSPRSESSSDEGAENKREISR